MTNGQLNVIAIAVFRGALPGIGYPSSCRFPGRKTAIALSVFVKWNIFYDFVVIPFWHIFLMITSVWFAGPPNLSFSYYFYFG